MRKRQRRLSGAEDLVWSLSAKGLTTSTIHVHLAEVYGADVSRQTISTITDKVLNGMTVWQKRPLGPVCLTIFLDAIARREALLNPVEVGDLHRVAVAAVA